MSHPRLALLLLVLSVLLPVQGLAQTPPPLVPAPPMEESYEPGAEDPESETQPGNEIVPREWSSPESTGLRISRIMLEFLGGSALGIAGGIPGAYIGILAAFESSSAAGFFAGVSLSFAGLTVGSALGIKGLGSLLDGEGRFGTTLLGSTLGGLAGLGLGLIVGFAAGSEAWILPVLAGPVIGGIIAYENSHASALQRRSAPVSPEMSVVPVVSVSPRGGVIGGLAGVF
jgi:hypothetical protein